MKGYTKAKLKAKAIYALQVLLVIALICIAVYFYKAVLIGFIVVILAIWAWGLLTLK